MDARRLLAFLGLALIAGSAFAWWPRAADVESELPSVGLLAPYHPDLLGAWEEVARIPAEHLGRGEILDLDELGDTLFVLQADRWLRFTAGGEALAGPFGSPVKGSPTWLESGSAIRAVPGGAVIIDRGRAVITRWSSDGSRGAERDFRARTGLGATMESIAVNADGTLLVSLRRILEDADGEWIVLRGRLGAAQFDTVYRGAKDPPEGEAHNIPRMATLPAGGFLLMPALEWRLLLFGQSDSATPSDVRRLDAPRWPVPDSIHHQYAKLLERLPPAQRITHALPPSFPPVRGLTVDASSRVLVLVAAGAANTHVEMLTTLGAPIGRLWDAPESRTVFVANGAAFRVEESADFTTIERLRPLAPKD